MVYIKISDKLKLIGLNSYEASSYLCISKYGIVDAKFISSNTNIPYGKIYQTLNSLITLGFIEVQNTRPKKYKILNVNQAFNQHMNRKKKEFQKEIKNTEVLMKELENEIPKPNAGQKSESNFWKVSFQSDIPKMIYECFSNAEKEIIISLGNRGESESLFAENETKLITTMLDKIKHKEINFKALIHKKIFSRYSKLFDKGNTKPITTNLKLLEKENSNNFIIFDRKIILIIIQNSLNQKKPIAGIKILNPKLAKEMLSEFNQLWKIS